MEKLPMAFWPNVGGKGKSGPVMTYVNVSPISSASNDGS